MSKKPALSVLQARTTQILHRESARAGALLLPALLGLAACGGRDDTAVAPPTSGETPPDGEGLGGGAPEAPTNSAILLAGQVYSPEAYNTYVGIFAEVPEGDVDFASFREFGNANVYSHAGYVFVEEDGVMQRFSVDANLELVEGPRFSWQEFGIASINASYTVFVSNERAYTFAPELGVVVVWSPEEMVRVGTLPIEMPERPAGMETFAYDGHLVGDQVIWNVFSGNFEAPSVYPAVTLAIADATRDDAPVRFIEDARCVPGGPAHVDDAGNYFVHGGGYYGYFLAYGDADPAARACILRVNAGESTFDPDYLVDYQALTGSAVSDPWFHIIGSQYMARSWDPSVPFPEDPDLFWDNAALRPLVIDTDASTAQPYPDLVGAKGVDGTTREVDGISYYQLSQTGYVENGDTDVVELHPE
ncbi:MAG TPA: hypothetical protein VMG12_13820, partial [Polyangiaceae bacterium]|nr:hypothetical protein [Polyangiaceae bacterium]